MKFGVVVFPGSNCDKDMIYVLETLYKQEVVSLWHKETDLQNCDFSNVYPVHSLKYRSNDSIEDSNHEFPLSLVIRIPISNADNIESILEQCSNTTSKKIEVWMSGNDKMISQISRIRRLSPLILLQYMSHSQVPTLEDSKPLLLMHKKTESTKSIVSIFVSASSLSLCEGILEEISDIKKEVDNIKYRKHKLSLKCMSNVTPKVYNNKFRGWGLTYWGD